MAYGWAIWNLRGAYFEAEHHGVWVNQKGQLIDVSPQMRPWDKILFLSDDTAIYDPSQFRSNRMQAEKGNALAAEFVDLALRRARILDAYRTGGAKTVRLKPLDQLQVGFLEQKLASILPRLSRG